MSIHVHVLILVPHWSVTSPPVTIVCCDLSITIATPPLCQVMDQSVALISEAKAAVQDPNAPNKQVRLAQAAKAVSQALNQVVNCLPGQIEFDHAIKAIAEASRRLQSGKVWVCVHVWCGRVRVQCITNL